MAAPKPPVPIVGRYQLQAFIGAGGMGQVWLARLVGAKGFDRKYVVKWMLDVSNAELVDFFTNEALLGMRLVHPNIVPVFDFFFEPAIERHCIVLEYIEGCSLLKLLQQGTTRRALDPELSAYIVRELLEALIHAHSIKLDGHDGQVVHRDISADNLLLSCLGLVLLADFGVARTVAKWKSRQTQHGALFGKYPYISPEMLNSEIVDGRADVYAAGLLLYELLSGRVAYDLSTETWEQKFTYHKNITEGIFEPLDRVAPGLNPALVNVVHRMMHHDRNQRFQTAFEAQDALDALFPQSYRARRRLAKMVNDLTKPQRTYSSPFMQLGEDVQMHLRKMIETGGVPVALPDDKTAPFVVADPSTVKGKKNAQPPAEGVPQVVDEQHSEPRRGTVYQMPTHPLPSKSAEPEAPAPNRSSLVLSLVVAAIVGAAIAIAVSFLARPASAPAAAPSVAKAAAQDPAPSPPVAPPAVVANTEPQKHDLPDEQKAGPAPAPAPVPVPIAAAPAKKRPRALAPEPAGAVILYPPGAEAYLNGARVTPGASGYPVEPGTYDIGMRTAAGDLRSVRVSLRKGQRYRVRP